MASFGETLKRERELRDISLRQVAEATKISIRYLEALEQNRFELLPGGLFNKGFIRAYSTYIGLDGEAMVTSYLQQMTAPQTGAETAPAPRTDPGLHRPAAVPLRRAGAVPEPPSAPVPMPPTPRFRPENQIEALRAALDGSHARPRPARSGHAGAEPLPAGSRALLWIVSAAAGVAMVFLLLSAFRRPAPIGAPSAASTRAEIAAAGPSPDVSPTGTSPAPGVSTAPATGASVDATHAVPPKAKEVGEAGPSLAGAAFRSMSPAARSSATPATAPAATEVATPPPSDAAAMDLEVVTSERTWVTVLCDGREVLNRFMQARESASLRCLSQIRVSARDAGTVQLAVNGSDCLPLGDPGTPAYGYTIRRDDYRQICPPERSGTDER